MSESSEQGEVLIDKVQGVGGIILGLSENRNWIALFYEGDLMHTKTVELPADRLWNIFVEEIPHQTTIYEHPRTMIYFAGPCDLEIWREGDKIVVRGCPSPEKG